MRNRGTMLLSCVVLALLAMTVFAQTDALGADLSSTELDHAIEEEMQKPEYAWRMPREAKQKTDSIWGNMGEWLLDVVRPLGGLFRGFMKWIEELFKDRGRQPSFEFDWRSGIQFLLFILLAVSLSILAILLLRMWQRRRSMPAIRAEAVEVTPEMLEEDIAADILPSDEWMKMARELLAKGNVRLAVRAMFLSSLAHLGENGLITIAKHKSNREYMSELRRHAHDQPELLAAFAGNIGMIERAWYGMHEIGHELLSVFNGNQERILGEK